MTPSEVHGLAVAHGLDHEQAIVATAIAWAESGLHPDAIGDSGLADEKWGPSIGLWQVRSLREDHGTGKERDGSRLHEPSFNARAMVAISNGGTKWTPWSVFKSGRYRQHLDAVRAAVEETGEPMTPADIIWAAMDDPLLADVDVTWVPGWQDRGRPYAFRPQGCVIHHTATSRRAAGDYPSLGIVRDGRSDLPGPLSQFGLGRSGTVYVIAAGTANHAGPGGWNGLSGNTTVWGVEAENDGIGEPWSAAALDSYPRLVAALARHTSFAPEMIACHREWSEYKIDPTGIDGDEFRAQVAALLAGNPPEPPQPQEVPNMFIFDGPDGGIWATDGDKKWGVPNGNYLQAFFFNPSLAGRVPHLGTMPRDAFDALRNRHADEGGAGTPMRGTVADVAPEPLACAPGEK